MPKVNSWQHGLPERLNCCHPVKHVPMRASNVAFRLGEGPSTERRTVCSMFGSRLVAEKRLKHANGPSWPSTIVGTLRLFRGSERINVSETD